MSPVKHKKQERPQRCLRSSFRGITEKKEGFYLFADDVRNLLPAIAAIFLYAVVTHLLFNRFCPMLIATGYPCPGCGMTRALILVLSGKMVQAWELQPPVYGWILFGLAVVIRRYFIRKPVLRREKNIWMLLLSLLLISSLVLYGYRIFTGFPQEIADPGRTLWELVRGMCSKFL